MVEDNESRRTLVNENGRDFASDSRQDRQPKKGAKETSPTRPEIDPYLVYFKRDDPECPFNYPLWKKWMIVLVIGIQIIWIAGLGASWSPANAVMAETFGTSELVMRIPQAMYLVGFSFGPVVLTPISEDYGRRIAFTASLVGVYIFQIPIALAPNLETLIVCRFIAGFIASPIFNSVCNVPDLWKNPNERMPGFALNFWALCAELVVLAPIWGAFITIRINWQWLWGISALVGIAAAAIFVVLVPETRHTVLLARRAKKLREKTGEDRYYCEGAIKQHRSINEVLKGTLYRPVWMLFTEPIVNLTALYDGLNYGIIYLAVEAVPLIYEQHGFTDPNVEFLFFSIIVGYLVAIAFFPLQWRLNQNLNKRRGEDTPEGKLYWGFFAGVAFPVSLYLFAWLSIPSIFWFVGLIPLALFGTASHILFVMISDYTVDSYGHLASSAVTGQSFARELMSAGLIIVGPTFYRNVGYPEATTILAAIATVLGVIPFAFFRYGPTIRERSKYSQEIKAAARKDEEREKIEDSPA